MTIFWAGDEASFESVLKAEAKVEQLLASHGAKAGYIDDMIARMPPIWRHEGDTAVVTLSGACVAGSAGYMRLFGVIGYDDFLAAAIEAATHPDTKRLMFHMETPGGDVTGLVEACETLTQITAMKPSSIYTGEQMCSAGYWLASAIKNNHITAGATAAVGSIGILKVHREATKMMEQDGVKVTVLRSGKYKAELNGLEAMTDDVRERALAQLADVHQIFRAQVAKGRPNLAAEDLAEVTEGQVFLGQRAVKAGLADRIGSFDLALKLLDKRKQPSNTSSNSKGKAMLTPEQIAAIAAGTPLQAFGLNADGTEMSASQITEYDAQVAKAKADAETKAQADADTAAAAAAAAAAEGAGITDADKGVVALLKEQVASANAEITTLKIAAASHTAMAAAHDSLLAIARTATANMLIPMGGTAAAVDGMDAAAIVAEHARLKPLFQAKFPVGGRAKAVTEDQGGDKSKASALPLGFQVALQSAASNKR